MLERLLLHSCLKCSRFLKRFLKTDFIKPSLVDLRYQKAEQFKMSDSTTSKPAKKTLTDEQKKANVQKMQEALALKRADPVWQAEQKRKREERKAGKAKKESDGSGSEDKPANGGAGAEDDSAKGETVTKTVSAGKRKSKPKGSDSDEKKEKKPSWWTTATEEQKAAAKAKAKATRDAKKAEKPAKEDSASE